MSLGSDQVGDPALVEAAVKQLWTAGPPGWTRITAEFDLSASPTVQGHAVDGAGETWPIVVPEAAVGHLVQCQRQDAAAGWPWRWITIEFDVDGNLSVRTTSETPSSVDPRATGPAAPRPKPGLVWSWWVWALAATAALTLLIVAIVGRDQDGATLRAMPASEQMSDDAARAVAGNTVRVWLRERNAQHLSNLRALTCPSTQDGAVALELEHVQKHERTRAHDVVATGEFHRDGSVWTLNTILDDGGVQFRLGIVGGELRVCQFDSAPVP